MGIDGNEVPEQLAKQGSLLPLAGPGLALCIPTEVAWEVIKGWTSRKHDGYRLPIRGQSQDKGFLTRHSAERAGELLNLSRNQLRILTRLLTGQSPKRTLLRLRLVESLE